MNECRYGLPCAYRSALDINKHDEAIRADEHEKVLNEVLEITKTIEAADILAMAESCDQNCNECDGCLTRILFEQLKGERT